MTTESGSRPVRQWRVTITEDRDGNATHAHLAWRTFPCVATKWDASRWYTFAAHECTPITSLEALKGLLADLAVADWYEARYPRQ